MGLLALGCALSLLTGCHGHDHGHRNQTDAAPFSLTILHINDHHSHLAPTPGSLTLHGGATQVEMGGFPRVVALAKQLAASQAHPLLLHAGDAITGDLYYTLFQGAADAALMNRLCFDAMVVGNHEFDNGDAGLRAFIDELHDGDCQTPVLAANVLPPKGVSPLYPESGSLLQPYLIKQYGDERVGIIGIATGRKTQSSSSPDASTQFLDETSTAQQYIDELQAQGVNKIVLLSHYGYGEDQAMAARLTGVDVIIDGDSHSLLGAGFGELGLNPAGPYPTEIQDAAGNQVCVAQAWQYADVLGELKVTFDGEGRVQACRGTPHLLLGDSFKQKDAEGNYVALTGDALTTLTAWVNDNPLLAMVPPDPAAQTRLEEYASRVQTMQATVIGQADNDLCLTRIPGDNRSALCASADTRAHGADISNLVAQAFLAMSVNAQIAIQNGGGVRSDVAAGDISIGTAYTLLPFANTLTNLDMTGAEIRRVLNEAVDYAFAPDGSTGSYPYAAGLRFDVDRARAAGARLFNIETRVKGSQAWVALDDGAHYRVVTNSFTAQGKDHYLTFGTVSAAGRAEDTYLDYAQSFVDYVKARGRLSKPAEEDFSTQHFYDADGVLQQ
ncbi:NAD nucleotidase [Pseudaeromonas sp. ZJS20]|uniref:NAD nucleotidase n=1 Tax=Pseudaeromonas aegiceratis TaxID=3153928 RepID=UPI00390CD421